MLALLNLGTGDQDPCALAPGNAESVLFTVDGWMEMDQMNGCPTKSTTEATERSDR